MPRLPLLPTIVVGLAVAAMIGLGVWQLERRQEKEALLARLAANFNKPVMAFPRFPVGDEHLFRRAGAYCLRAVKWRHAGAGSRGFRLIAECARGAEGPALLIDMGTTHDPRFEPVWKGGAVTGTITHAPQDRALLADLLDHRPKTLMLVSETAAPGLEADERPGLGSVPNNHLAYAVQWFLFAGVALAIYLLALRYRQRKTGAPPAP